MKDQTPKVITLNLLQEMVGNAPTQAIDTLLELLEEFADT